jgi:hypothetical protein
MPLILAAAAGCRARHLSAYRRPRLLPLPLRRLLLLLRRLLLLELLHKGAIPSKLI